MGCLSDVPITVTGQAPLLSRPIGELAEALRALGCSVLPTTSLSLPLTVSRGDSSTHMGNEVTIKGDISSQFVSALMMIGPLLPNGLHIHVTGELVSRSYVEMTAHVMNEFGASVHLGQDEIVISPTGYTPTSIEVEPDFSSAVFPLVAGVLSGQQVRIPGAVRSRVQGDARIIGILEQMGSEIEVDHNGIVLTHQSTGVIKPLSMNMADCSDLVPAVATLCTFANGVSELSGIDLFGQRKAIASETSPQNSQRLVPT